MKKFLDILTYNRNYSLKEEKILTRNFVIYYFVKSSKMNMNEEIKREDLKIFIVIDTTN